MFLGVDYYPEQWDPAQMDADRDTILAEARRSRDAFLAGKRGG